MLLVQVVVYDVESLEMVGTIVVSAQVAAGLAVVVMYVVEL